MNTSGDAAESIVRMSLQGFEVSSKIKWKWCKKYCSIISGNIKDKQQTKGKQDLLICLNLGKNLKYLL